MKPDDEIQVPADIRAISEIHLLTGDEDGDDDDLDIDDIFGRKSWSEVYADGDAYYPKGWAKVNEDDFVRPSDLEEGYRFASFEYGTFLINSDGKKCGGFIASELNVNTPHQGRGLGKELVVEHFLHNGDLATWHLDTPAYSPEGEGAIRAAHDFPRTHPDAYLKKLARHIVFLNEALFAPLVGEDGNDRIVADLAPRLAGAVGDAALRAAVREFVTGYAPAEASVAP